jgi:hypothetical protein
MLLVQSDSAACLYEEGLFSDQRSVAPEYRTARTRSVLASTRSRLRACIEAGHGVCCASFFWFVTDIS